MVESHAVCRLFIAGLIACSLARSNVAFGMEEPLPSQIEFNRDIRPIFSDTCYKCHGPDKAQRKADLRLDTEAGAFAKLGDGGTAIVPGDLAKSELVRRISSADDDERMPPADS